MNAKKFLSFVSALLLFLLLPVCTFAFEASEQKQEPTYPEGAWSLSQDDRALLCDDEEYRRLSLSASYGVHASVKRLGKITAEQDVYYVGASVNDPNLIYLYKSTSQIERGEFHSAYYKKQDISNIEQILGGGYDGYFLLNYTGAERICQKEDIEKFNSALNGKGNEVDVTLFENAKVYELYGTYQNGALIYNCGAFFKTLTAVYYVDFSNLPNNALDSNGNLSTREGNVKALLLEGEELALFEDYKNAPETEYFEEIGEPVSPIVYWILLILSSAFFGFLLPALPLVFSIIQAVRKKTRHPGRYVALAILSILWMILFLMILLVLLI